MSHQPASLRRLHGAAQRWWALILSGVSLACWLLRPL